jgi:hypothetical protein
MVALEIAGAIERDAVVVCESEAEVPVAVIVAPDVVPAAVEAARVN